MKNHTFDQLFEKWHLKSIKLNIKFASMEFAPNDVDREAAWELYVELLTRITTQCLPLSDGDEKTALDSVYSIFPITREILKRKGRQCTEFSKIAIPVLNQVVRPFTAKWHKLSLNNAFEDAEKCNEFREELKNLQTLLKHYTSLLSEIAEVEDLSGFENPLD
jgi:hypothetical protein